MNRASLNLGVAVGLTLVGLSVAQANELKVDLRSDYVNTDYNEAVGTADNASFQMSRLRLDLKGDLGELTSYRLRTDLLNIDAVPKKRERSSAFVDIALISRVLVENVKLNIGKFATGIGGWEGSLSSADFYLGSQAYQDYRGGGNALSDLQYMVGVGLEYSLHAHTITAMLGNPGRDITTTGDETSGEINQDRNAWGVKYSGRFAEGTLLPVVTYFEEDQNIVGTTKRKNTWIGIGGKVDLEMFDLEGDINYNTYKGRTAADQDDKLSSYYLLARYKYAGINPHVKYEIAERKANNGTTESKTDITGLTLALEYVPVLDEVFRYHVAYTDLQEKPENQADRRTQTIYVGVRMLADLLK